MNDDPLSQAAEHSIPLPAPYNSDTTHRQLALELHRGEIPERVYLNTLLTSALQEATVALSRCPLIANPPPLIMDSSNLTLLDLGSRRYLPSSDLPPACQVASQQDIPTTWPRARVMLYVQDVAALPMKHPLH